MFCLTICLSAVHSSTSPDIMRLAEEPCWHPNAFLFSCSVWVSGISCQSFLSRFMRKTLNKRAVPLLWLCLPALPSTHSFTLCPTRRMEENGRIANSALTFFPLVPHHIVWLVCCLFIHLFILTVKFLPSTCCVPGGIYDAECTKVNKIDEISVLMELTL